MCFEREREREREREGERERDEFHNGVRGGSDTLDDGRSEREGREYKEAHLRHEGSVREDEGDVEFASPSVRFLDSRATQRSAPMGCSDQPSRGTQRPIRRRFSPGLQVQQSLVLFLR